MRVLPILFNTDMVRAILDGRKTVTRRVVKFAGNRNPNWTGYIKDGLVLYNGTNEPCNIPCQYSVGDILYVRETWKKAPNGYFYYEDWQRGDIADVTKWKPSIHMPKEAARIFLKIKDVRVERLKDMNEVDTAKEGIRTDIQTHRLDDPDFIENFGGIDKFKELWNSTIKKADLDKYGWNANPWVWVIEFERCEKRRTFREEKNHE